MFKVDGNKVIAVGQLSTANMRNMFACIHQVVEKRGYQDMELDFTGVTSLFPTPAIAIASICNALLVKNNVPTTLFLPNNTKLGSLFKNAGWAHLIDPNNFQPSKFVGRVHMLATKFKDSAGQNQLVDNAISSILSATEGISRPELGALEWSLNEITDNVMNHSESEIGGLVQLSHYKAHRKAIEFVVCDMGLGIPATLKKGHSQIRSDTEALDMAIREGVTRSDYEGQGNGLFGSYRIANLSQGEFEIHSGYAALSYNRNAGYRVAYQAIPFNGSLVSLTFNYDNPAILDDVLQFKGMSHTPIDSVELRYNEDIGGNIEFVLSKESEGFGSRIAGRAVRKKLLNLVRFVKGQVKIDFTDVHLVSSSYADAAFGGLFVELGAVEFSQKICFINHDEMIANLINRAISQRIKTGLGQ